MFTIKDPTQPLPDPCAVFRNAGLTNSEMQAVSYRHGPAMVFLQGAGILRVLTIVGAGDGFAATEMAGALRDQSNICYPTDWEDAMASIFEAAGLNLTPIIAGADCPTEAASRGASA